MKRKTMDKQRKTNTRRGLASLVGAGLILLGAQPKTQADILASAGASGYHDQAYGTVALDNFSLGSNKKLSLQAELNYSGDIDQTKAKVGVFYRNDPNAKRSLGANIYGFHSAKHNYLTIGGEYFTEKNQFFVNGYVGDFNGVEGGLVRDIFYNKDRTATLRGLIGGYYLRGDCDESCGVQGGLRFNIPITKNKKWSIVGEGNVFSDPAFTGQWSARLGIQYGEAPSLRRVENLYLIEPCCEGSRGGGDDSGSSIGQGSTSEHRGDDNKNKDRDDKNDDNGKDDPSIGLSGGNGSANPVGNSGLSGGNGSANPTGNSGLSGGNGFSNLGGSD